MTAKVIHQGRTILFTNRHRDRLAGEGWRLVRMGIASFDKAFQRAESYVGHGGGRHWLSRLAEAEEVTAPIVYIEGDGSVCFEDGRHRYAALRDAGHATIPVAMSAESRANAKRYRLPAMETLGQRLARQSPHSLPNAKKHRNSCSAQTPLSY